MINCPCCQKPAIPVGHRLNKETSKISFHYECACLEGKFTFSCYVDDKDIYEFYIYTDMFMFTFRDGSWQLRYSAGGGKWSLLKYSESTISPDQAYQLIQRYNKLKIFA